MKFVVIGLGHFGTALAERLVAMGHEVIGVDKSMNRVEACKEKLTNVICLDSSDPVAASHLPLKNTDMAIVCGGADEGESLLITAMLKKRGVQKITVRSITALQESVLEAMGITEIIRPERESAERWAMKLSVKNYINLFEVSRDHYIVEIIVPAKLIGKTIAESELNKKYNVIVLTKLKQISEQNEIGAKTFILKAGSIVDAKTVLEEGDIIVVYGNKNDIKAMIDKNM
ncbi:MAG: TrkA family potassium uptake protein [Fermentimonas sp.]|jgi:trk system potassium uptake protein TrkA|nr:TrkA family potassium uptake protein [Fermentimonas sp.]NLC85567.1 TrkA family potassium uptake protein [Bacteroidales bacterium]HBT86001.1 potassium transporter TrkA [Porphyromonadaceae bacterium]MDD3189784.1 TrkA family potassium uptake protein [Fermentimonas sp.]MDD4283415.1 TrkA family potassium uptake protein [Fermentimonas sp.]